MNKLKISKYKYNDKDLKINKHYFVFTFFNTNLSIVNLLTNLIEESLDLKTIKLISKSDMTFVYLEINIENYFLYKQEFIEFFLNENFNFNLLAIYYNKKYIQVDFFENNFLDELDFFEFIDEIFYFSFIKNIYAMIKQKIFIFLLYNIIVLNKNLFIYNVYNSSSSF